MTNSSKCEWLRGCSESQDRDMAHSLQYLKANIPRLLSYTGAAEEALVHSLHMSEDADKEPAAQFTEKAPDNKPLYYPWSDWQSSIAHISADSYGSCSWIQNGKCWLWKLKHRGFLSTFHPMHWQAQDAWMQIFLLSSQREKILQTIFKKNLCDT